MIDIKVVICKQLSHFTDNEEVPCFRKNVLKIWMGAVTKLGILNKIPEIWPGVISSENQ